MNNSLKIGKREIIIYAVLFAFITKLAIGVFVTSTFDVFWYRNWILDIQNGLFTIYSRADAIKLDYPPLFLVLTYPISLLYRIIPPDTYKMADMLFMKLIPITFDLLSGWLIYKITKENQKVSLIALAFWLLNPSVFFNSVIWGQTDSIISFFILLTFYYIMKEKPLVSTVIFACACMIKFQCAFLAPVFLIALIDILKERKFKDTLYCILGGLITVLLVFVPFSIGAHNPLLIFKVYFGSTGSYPYCTVNAANVYSVFMLNWKPNTTEFLGLSIKIIGYIFAALGIAFVIFARIFGKNKCSFLAMVFLMQHLFMFMTDMHERYQFIILPLILIVWALYGKRRYLLMFAGYTVTTLANQWIVLANFTKSNLPWQGHFDTLLAGVGILNIVLYIWTAYEFTAFSFKE